eukprot:m.169611 g.169611  ORF g.169611 m.169611 type:complete len:368 (-) comp31577_c0_seq1:190-1293(-)
MALAACALVGWGVWRLMSWNEILKSNQVSAGPHKKALASNTLASSTTRKNWGPKRKKKDGESSNKQYFCKICDLDCVNKKAWLSHSQGKKHISRHEQLLKTPSAPNKWKMEELRSFPQRLTTLDQHTMVATLDEVLKQRINVYLLDRFPHSPEFVTIFSAIMKKNPKHLRVKEFFETLETALQVGNEIRTQLKTNTIACVYDMACGHGLLGILLAYRFSTLAIVCVDTERRECFDTYIEAFGEHGVLAVGESKLLENLSFAECNLAEVEVAEKSFLIGIHGCNGATKVLLEIAQSKRCGYSVMPCCIKEGLYQLRTSSQNKQWAMGETDVRYAALVGFIAGKYDASKICAIDRQITDRQLLISGRFS